MKSEVDEIALQGIEFWSTVCDEEVDLGIELTEVCHGILLFISLTDLKSAEWLILFQCYVSDRLTGVRGFTLLPVLVSLCWCVHHQCL